jgi:hypothetical protein
MLHEGLSSDILDMLLVNMTPSKNNYAYTHSEADRTNRSFSSPSYTFTLTKNQVEMIGEYIEDNRSNIPSGFIGNWQNLVASRAGMRASDLADFMVFAIPNIVAPMFENELVKKALLDISRAVELALQWELSSSDVDEIDRYSSICNNKLILFY